MVARAILIQAKPPRLLQTSLKTMRRHNRVRGVPSTDAPAGTLPANIWKTLETRLDEQSEEIADLMKAAGLTRVSAQATERSKMMDQCDKTKENVIEFWQW